MSLLSLLESTADRLKRQNAILMGATPKKERSSPPKPTSRSDGLEQEIQDLKSRIDDICSRVSLTTDRMTVSTVPADPTPSRSRSKTSKCATTSARSLHPERRDSILSDLSVGLEPQSSLDLSDVDLSDWAGILSEASLSDTSINLPEDLPSSPIVIISPRRTRRKKRKSLKKPVSRVTKRRGRNPVKGTRFTDSTLTDRLQTDLKALKRENALLKRKFEIYKDAAKKSKDLELIVDRFRSSLKKAKQICRRQKKLIVDLKAENRALQKEREDMLQYYVLKESEEFVDRYR